MPIVTVHMLAGRSLEQKRRLVAMLSDAMVACVGARRASVNVIINEIPIENWAQDGLLLSEFEDRADAARG